MLCTSSETGEEVDLFRFIKPGKVTVCASSGVDIGLASEMEFTATVREIESIALDRDSYEMKEGEELQLKPQISPADGHMLTGIIQIPGFAEPMHFNETLPPAPTYTMDPLSGIWKRNNVDALPYGCRM